MAVRYRTIAASTISAALALSAALLTDAGAQAPEPAAAAAADKGKAKGKRAGKAKAEQAGEGQAAAPAKLDAAEAQRVVDGAQKSLQAGKADAAVTQLSRVVATSGLPTPIMARALYVRGLAQRKQSRPAQAISDLTSAIWLKGGLNDTDRADALAQRAAAYRDVGLPDQGGGAASQSATQAATQAAAPQAAGSAAATARASTQRVGSGGVPTGDSSPQPVFAAAPSGDGNGQASSSSSGVGSFLANLFSGGSSQQAPPAPAALPDKTASIAPPAVQPPPQIGAAWSSDTSTAVPRTAKRAAKAPKGAPEQPPVAAAAPAPAPAPVQQAAPAQKTAAKGRVRIQVASLASREEAQALIARIKKELAVQLTGYEAAIDTAEVGAFGTQHRVRIGSFARPEDTRDLCTRFRQARLDCMIVNQ